MFSSRCWVRATHLAKWSPLVLRATMPVGSVPATDSERARYFSNVPLCFPPTSRGDSREDSAVTRHKHSRLWSKCSGLPLTLLRALVRELFRSFFRTLLASPSGRSRGPFSHSRERVPKAAILRLIIENHCQRRCPATPRRSA